MKKTSIVLLGIILVMFIAGCVGNNANQTSQQTNTTIPVNTLGSQLTDSDLTPYNPDDSALTGSEAVPGQDTVV